ncbi:MAG: citramalate synthase [Coriobacteriales bacterium]|jgi:2-isopropylmalate synthase|nr:citramalate synthase [Coriobacteriales bacterium]
MPSIALYDTTLRDGAQREGVHLTVEDKLRIALRLDTLGVHYIEGGFPASNPRDSVFFEQAARLELKSATLVAFGMTARKQTLPSKDVGLQALAACSAPVVSLAGKAWGIQVERVLETTPAENLRMIFDSIAFLCAAGKRLFFDAEHYFDAYQADSSYALKVLEAAIDAGAEAVVLCDTNGGALPHQVAAITRETLEALKARNSASAQVTVGIHCHNDSGCAVANTLEAVRVGATQVQGTINGYGERAGNADLLIILANLELKLGQELVGAERLRLLTPTANFVAETFTIAPDPYHPYSGSNAFAHKGGIHVSAALRSKGSYEHVSPEQVGNFSHIVVSELAGKAALEAKARELGIALPKEPKKLQELLDTVKERESQGYSYEVADASLALLLKAESGEPASCFKLESFRVLAEKREDGRVMSEATIKVLVDGERHVATGEGNGPVNALDAALRLAIGRFYPQVANLELTDYKVRVLDESGGTDAVTRTVIETTDGTTSWGTVGVSENIIEASWDALVDSITYGLLKTT